MTTIATAMTAAVPARRFGLLFRAQLRRRDQYHSSLRTGSHRHASSSSSSGGGGEGKRASGKKTDGRSGAGGTSSSPPSSSSSPQVLEKPDRFRPPSHPARLAGRGSRAPPVRNYGPDLTAEERAAQRTKRYPHSMPPEGSLMHWFLTNRTIHLWITLTFLFGTGLWAFVLNIRQNSPFAHMLPSAGELLRHPLDSVYQAIQVFKITTEHHSRITAEKRRLELEEVQRRKAYRIAHGLEGMDGIDEADPIFAAALASRLEREAREKEGLALEGPGAGEKGVDVEAKAEPRKKWFGVW